jgi:hypothetical protein
VNRQTWMGLGLVALLGVSGAMALWMVNGEQAVDERVVHTVDAAPDAVKDAGQSTRSEVSPVRATPTSDVAARVVSDELNPDLDQAYDAAMNTSLQLPSVQNGTSARDLENAMQQDLLAVTGEVVLAAEAHTEFAKQAPRRQADRAVERAAVLYEHLASTIDESPVPPGLSEPEQAVFQTMLERLAGSHARKAAALRAQGVPR